MPHLLDISFVQQIWQDLGVTLSYVGAHEWVVGINAHACYLYFVCIHLHQLSFYIVDQCVNLLPCFGQ